MSITTAGQPAAPSRGAQRGALVPRLAALGLGLVLGASACGTVPASPPSVTTARHTQPPGPASGSRAQARDLADRILGELALPAGARRVSLSPLPQPLRVPPLWAGTSTSADVHGVYRLALSMAAANGYVLAHRPAGFGSLSTGTSGGTPGGTSVSVSYQMTSAPAWVRSAQLTALIVPDPSGGSLLRLDAQVRWYPPRSAAEYISPDAYRQVVVSASFMNPRPRTFRKVITARAEIAGLATLLDNLHAAGQIVMFCPLVDANYRLTFRDPVAGQPVVQATMTVCLTIGMTVGGKQQPDLFGSGTLIPPIRRILGLTSRYW